MLLLLLPVSVRRSRTVTADTVDVSSRVCVANLCIDKVRDCATEEECLENLNLKARRTAAKSYAHFGALLSWKVLRDSLRLPAISWILCALIVLHLNLTVVTADCWYENARHTEGDQVRTGEPCLNCTCARGVLLCYLRVCPRLPNPPPSGCILLHRYHTCCPELICADAPAGNSIEARAEIGDGDDDELRGRVVEQRMQNACVVNGSIYAPGSAMASSSGCEHCYCIGGEQHCIRPTCLLPHDGCVPSYDEADCCPARYNCTRDPFTTTSTTTSAPLEYDVEGGCVVDGKFYAEGGKVLGVGHSACDNCYCLRGLVRCEPLSCASSLYGCTPVIRPGECCAASYNCSGAIETQPEANYGQFPTVSKEYAKLRKEVQQAKRAPPAKSANLNDDAPPYYVIAESTKEHKHPTTRAYTLTAGFITQSPFYYNLTADVRNASNKDGGREQQLQPEIYYVPTKVAAAADVYREDALATTIRHKKYTSSSEEVAHVHALLEERITRGILNESHVNQRRNISNETTEATTEKVELTTLDLNASQSETTVLMEEIELSTMTGTEPTTTIQIPTTTDVAATSTLVVDETTTTTPLMELVELITVRTVFNTTDCITFDHNLTKLSTPEIPEESVTSTETVFQQILTIEHRHSEDEVDGSSSQTTTELTTLDPSEVSNEIMTDDELAGITDTTEGEDSLTTTTIADNESQAQIATVTVAPNVKYALDAIRMRNKSGVDYDYDYNAPTLPPSLPNLRIIPFVAADALDSKKDQKDANNLYGDADEDFSFNNHFSPPVETEGGFVPKEPPVVLTDRFYDDYRTTHGEDVSGVTSMPAIPALTNPPKSDENNCMMDAKEVKHGESVASEGNCALCVCFYGSIVCHAPQCPIPSPGCHTSKQVDRSTCCPEIVCDTNESPTVDETSTKASNVIADPVTPSDPFKDVIRTEPAPDFHLLMGDMSNYLLKQGTTTPQPPMLTTHLPSDPQRNTSAILSAMPLDENELSFNKLWDLLFNGEVSTTPASVKPQADNAIETREQVDGMPLGGRLPVWAASATKRVEHAPGLLKLAGCNIYGRMYRVGRIISELSGPCMECKCTEVGVQCEDLTC